MNEGSPVISQQEQEIMNRYQLTNNEWIRYRLTGELPDRKPELTDEEKMRQLRHAIAEERKNIGFSAPNINVFDKHVSEIYNQEVVNRYPLLQKNEDNPNKDQEIIAFRYLNNLYTKDEKGDRVKKPLSQYQELDAVYRLYNAILTTLNPEDKDYLKLRQKLFDAFLNEENPTIEKGIAKCNLGLVFTIAHKHSIPIGFLPIRYAIEAGNIGLVRAIQKYDISKGIRFAPYGGKTITGSILNARAEYLGVARSVYEDISKLRVLVARNNGEMLTVKQIMQEFNIAETETAEALITEYYREPTISLEQPITPFEDRTALDSLGESQSMEEGEREGLLDLLKDMEKVIPPRDILILQLRIVIGLTQKETAVKLAELTKTPILSTARIEQIQIRALRKLREAFSKPDS